jgi:hypothetical protein
MTNRQMAEVMSLKRVYNITRAKVDQIETLFVPIDGVSSGSIDGIALTK